MEVLAKLPNPRPGDRVTFMGNTGEGKSVAAATLLLAQPDVIVVNTKHDPFWSQVGTPIDSTDKLFKVEDGRFDFHPPDGWERDFEQMDRFFLWALKAGNRVIYIDEFNDLCPSAMRYPYALQKAIKQGRWRKLGVWGSAQEPVRTPSFCFGQSQHRYLFFLGWDPYRKMAESWFQEPIDWAGIPERSNKFYLKTPVGTFGPQPKIQTTLKF